MLYFGKYTEDELDNLIDDWHSEVTGSENLELHEYLGVTWEEYSNWFSHSSINTKTKCESCLENYEQSN